MGKPINYIVIDGNVSNCHLNNVYKGLETDGYEAPYGYDVLMHYNGSSNELCCIEILDLDLVAKVIDNDDCLPDVGLLDYGDMKDRTLREIYKSLIETNKK
jgi:hypothetical protein